MAIAVLAVASACTQEVASEQVATDEAAITARPDASCTYRQYGGHDYWVCTSARTWAAAHTTCASVAMHLARPDDAAENEYIRSQIGATSWIGGGDQVTEGQWRWTDNNDLFWSGAANGSAQGGRYTRWVSGEPNNTSNQDCAELRTSDGRWSDNLCSTSRAFVCESSAATAAAPQAPDTACTVHTSGGSTYWVCDNQRSWDAARDRCRSIGMDLVSIDNSTESNYVRATARSSHHIGLTDREREGDWRRPSNDRLLWCGDASGSAQLGLYTNWGSGHPTQSANECSPFQAGGKSYYFCGAFYPWSDARAQCQGSAGMSLGKIESAAENEQVYWNLWNDVWLDASDLAQEGNWTWGDGTAFWSGGASGSPVSGAYAPWMSGEPNNSSNQDCGVMAAWDGYWYDDTCTCSWCWNSFLCEGWRDTGVPETNDCAWAPRTGEANAGRWFASTCSTPRSYVCESLPAAAPEPPPPTGSLARHRADRCSYDCTFTLRCDDLSGNGNIAYAPDSANQPGVIDNRIGGKPALASQAGDKMLFGNPSIDLGSSYTLVVVGQYMGQTAYPLDLQPGTTAAGHVRMSAEPTQGEIRLLHDPQGTTGDAELAGRGCSAQTQIPLTNGQPYVAVVVGTPEQLSFYLNNALQQYSPAPATPLTLYGTFADGAQAAVETYGHTVAETIFYNRALTTEELATLHTYIQSRYGIATASCPPATCAGAACAACGDGVVTGSEACDTGIDAYCNASCAGYGGLDRCTTNADCGAGRVCGQGNGWRYGLEATGSVCEPDIDCSAGDPSLCGDITAPCGLCVCQPSCEDKQCGDDMSDGCGGLCPAACLYNEPGCNLDSDCPSGQVCGHHVGPRFGFPPDVNVCWDVSCEPAEAVNEYCGDESAPCGRCPVACTPSCTDRACGDADSCGGICTGPTASCAEQGDTCNHFGECINQDDLDDRDATLTATALGLPAGEISVGPNGSAQYSIPIALPPGPRGATPSVGLQYDSGLGDGLLAHGWAISGMSAITRCQRTRPYFAHPTPVFYDERDLFCLDGKPLVTSGVEGGDGTVYSTVPDTFVKVVSHSPDGPEVGPNGFTVYQKDGSRYEFGGEGAQAFWEDEDGVRHVRDWYLRRTVSRFGVEVSYEYEALTEDRDNRVDTVQVYPTAIRYGRDEDAEGDSAPFAVTFEYQRRRDPRFGVHFGMLVRRHRLLESVTTWLMGATQLRQYRLEYEAFADGTQKLTAIRECAGSGEREACKEPTVFSYFDDHEASPPIDPAPSDTYLSEALLLGTDVGASSPVYVLDANGDGRDDVAYLTAPFTPGGGWHLALSSVGGLDEAVRVEGWYPNPGAVNLDPELALVLARYGQVVDADAPQVHAGDFDNNGRDDLLSVEPESLDVHSIVDLNFETASYPIDLAGQTVHNSWSFDADGDGDKDVFVCTGGSPSEEPESVPNRMHFFRNHLDGFAQEEMDSEVSDIGNGCTVSAVLDITGDAVDDILIHNADGLQYLAVDGFAGVISDFVRSPDPGTDDPVPTLAVADHMFNMDVNEDGLSDLVLTNHDFEQRMLLNTGTSGRMMETTPERWVMASGRASGDKSFFSYDIDNNGRADLASYGPDSPRTAVIYRAGIEGETTQSLRIQLTFPEVRSVHPADFNGDGAMDLVQVDEDARLYIRNNIAPRQKLLRYVDKQATPDDETRTFTRIEYTRGAGDDAYATVEYQATQASPTLRKLPAMDWPAVRSYQSYSRSRNEIKEMHYENAHFDLDAGWLGFERVGVSTQHPAIPTQTLYTDWVEFKQSTHRRSFSDTMVYPFAFAPTSVHRQWTQPESPLSAETTHEVGSWTIYEMHSTLGPYFAYPQTILTSNVAHGTLETAGIGTITTLTPDEYGNPDLVEIDYFDQQRAVVMDYSYDRDEQRVEQWQINLVDQLEITDSVAGELAQTVTRSFDYTHAEDGRLERVVSEPTDDALALEQAYAYDGWGNVERITVSDRDSDTLDRVTQLDYDPLGVWPAIVTNAENHVSRYDRYYAHGALARKQDPNGVLVEVDYDAFGRLIEQRQIPSSDTPEAPTLRTTYTWEQVPADESEDAFPLPTAIEARVTNPDGSLTRLAFDDAGSMIRRIWTDPLGEGEMRQEIDLDAFGRAERIARPHRPGSLYNEGSQGQFTYQRDPIGRVLVEERPDQSFRRFYYADVLQSTLAGELASIPTARFVEERVNPRGHSELRATDDLGRPVWLRDARGGVTTYAYGVQDATVRIEDANGNVTRALPDRFGRNVELRDPNVGHHTFGYDAFGDLVRTNDNGGVTTYARDRLGRILRQNAPDSAAEWEWDLGVAGIGKLHAFESVGHRRELTYAAAFGQLDSITDAVSLSSGSIAMTTFYDYDDERARLERLTFPSGFELEYEYGPTGTVVAVRDGEVDADIWRAVDVYDDGRGISREEFGNHVSVTYQHDQLAGWVYDMAGELPNGSAFIHDVYNRDVNRNLIYMRQLGVSRLHYVYDELDRLTDVIDRSEPDSPVTIESFAYDAIGNITAASGFGAYDYERAAGDPVFEHAQPQAVRAAGGNAYRYDVHGNQVRRAGPAITGGLQDLRYDSLNRLVGIDVGGTAALDPARSKEFVYGADGTLVLERRANDEVVFSGDYQRHVENGSLVEEVHRVVANGAAVAEVRRDGLSGAQQISYVHADPLGSIRCTTDEDGVAHEGPQYSAFGRPVQLASMPTEIGYTGHRDLRIDALVHAGGRVYDAQLGRFLSADPFVFEPFSPQDLNRYSYVRNNPLRFTDPSGFKKDELPEEGDQNGGGGWLSSVFQGAKRMWDTFVGVFRISVPRHAPSPQTAPAGPGGSGLGPGEVLIDEVTGTVGGGGVEPPAPPLAPWASGGMILIKGGGGAMSSSAGEHYAGASDPVFVGQYNSLTNPSDGSRATSAWLGNLKPGQSKYAADSNLVPTSHYDAVGHCNAGCSYAEANGTAAATLAIGTAREVVRELESATRSVTRGLGFPKSITKKLRSHDSFVEDVYNETVGAAIYGNGMACAPGCATAYQNGELLLTAPVTGSGFDLVNQTYYTPASFPPLPF